MEDPKYKRKYEKNVGTLALDPRVPKCWGTSVILVIMSTCSSWMIDHAPEWPRRSPLLAPVGANMYATVPQQFQTTNLEGSCSLTSFSHCAFIF